jgi:hypothetical protein
MLSFLLDSELQILFLGLARSYVKLTTVSRVICLKKLAPGTSLLLTPSRLFPTQAYGTLLMEVLRPASYNDRMRFPPRRQAQHCL